MASGFIYWGFFAFYAGCYDARSLELFVDAGTLPTYFHESSTYTWQVKDILLKLFFHAAFYLLEKDGNPLSSGRFFSNN